MSFLFVDGFDHYGSASILDKWTATVGGGTPDAFIGTDGRSGTGAIRFPNNTGFGYSKNVTASSVVVVGFAFKSVGAVDNSRIPILSLRDGSTHQVQLQIDSGGLLAAYGGEATSQRQDTRLGLSLCGINADGWYYLEMRTVVGSPSGSVEIRAGGKTILFVENAPTQASANGTIDSVVIGPMFDTGAALAGDWLYDDLYVLDVSSSPNMDFLGDVRVIAIGPTANGATAQWSASAGQNFQNVDEADPNDDTDFNTGAAGQTDTFVFANLGVNSANVRAVATHINARQDDPGTRSIRPTIRLVGSNFAGVTTNVTSAYSYYSQIYEQSPQTSNSWSVLEVNSAEFGYNRVD